MPKLDYTLYKRKEICKMTDRKFNRWKREELRRQRRYGLAMIIFGALTIPCGVGFILLPLGVQMFQSNELGWLAD